MGRIKQIGLTAKLVIAVLLSSIVIYLLVFGLGYSLTNHVIYRNVRDIGNNIIDNAVEKIDTIVEQVSRISSLMGLIAKYNLNNREEFFDILKRVVLNNKDVFGVSVSYEPFMAHEGERFFSPYCYRKDSDVTCEMIGGKDYDYFNMPWYHETKRSGNSMWTAPYTDPSLKGFYILSHSAPFYKSVNGRQEFEGVVSADISMEWLQNTVANVANKYNGYAFLISRDGRFITFPKEGFAMKRNIKEFEDIPKIAEEMTDGKTGIAPLKDFVTGVPSWIFYKPVDLSNWSIGVVFEEKEILSSVNYIARRMIVLCMLGTAALFFVVFFLSKRITRPINMLSLAARKISKGDLNVELPAMSRKDEVGVLARSFSSMQDDLKQYISELSKTIASQERITNELKIAHDIQQSIVPEKFPKMGISKNVEVYGTLLPALEVGGDLYDCFEIDEKHICFVAGDVSDKGVHAAFIMAIVSTLLRGLSKNLRHPDDLLKIVNEEVLKRNAESMFVTLFCGIFNSETGRFRYANAGHVPPVLIRKDAKPIFIKGALGKPLGVGKGSEYPWGSIMLSCEDKIFMYTDGVTEAVNPKDELFGEERLAKELSKYSSSDPKDLLDKVLAAVKTYAGGKDLPDDIAMLSFSMLTCDPRRLNLTLLNDLQEVRRLAHSTEDFCKSFGCSREFAGDLNVVLEEIITNIVRFAYDDKEEHTIDVSLIYSDNKIEITVIDDGKQFDPLKAPSPDLSLGLKERPVGGLGIELVKKMTDMIKHERIGNYNKLTIVKNIKGGS